MEATVRVIVLQDARLIEPRQCCMEGDHDERRTANGLPRLGRPTAARATGRANPARALRRAQADHALSLCHNRRRNLAQGSMSLSVNASISGSQDVYVEAPWKSLCYHLRMPRPAYSVRLVKKHGAARTKQVELMKRELRKMMSGPTFSPGLVEKFQVLIDDMEALARVTAPSRPPALFTKMEGF